ncbi:MAG: ArsR family transcriptional regulator [Promethearchaeota archaeon]|nr:MAG: ArsR family transcriptional regulator [Candidatus Lokiarchaeota archaeon]
MENIDREIIKILKVLADSSRFKILHLLENNKMNAKMIQKKLGKSQSTISQHLILLVKANLVKYTITKRRKVYSLRNPEIMKILSYIKMYVVDEHKKKLEFLQEFDRHDTLF